MQSLLDAMQDEEDKFEESDELVDEDDNGFKIGDRLQAPNVTQFTTRQLFHFIHEGQIELNPPYQRGACGHNMHHPYVDNVSRCRVARDEDDQAAGLDISEFLRTTDLVCPSREGWSIDTKMRGREAATNVNSEIL